MGGAALSDAVALVTGASSGIGADIARELAARGVGELVLVARRRERLEELAAELGERARVHVADLTRPDEVARLAEAVPRVDVLVNNAGFGWGGRFVEHARTDPERLLRMVDLNCRAVVQLCAAWVPGMVERGRGWVLNVGSIAGSAPMPTYAVYGPTKSFVNDFTEALRIELRGTGVRVHLLAPGPVHTEFFDVAHGRAERPFPWVFLDSRRVARQSVDALLADRARLVPGAHVALAWALLAGTPRCIYRPLAGLVARLAAARDGR